MKKPVCSPSRFLLDVAFVIALFCISNGCTKISDENTQTPGPPPPVEYNVSISGGFNPSVLTVKAGTVVTWANNDNPVQSVTSDDGFFDGIVTTNGTYSYKFESAGIYTYHSRMNPFMVGEVDVN
jgi:plastocyanin